MHKMPGAIWLARLVLIWGHIQLLAEAGQHELDDSLRFPPSEFMHRTAQSLGPYADLC